ncbi:NIPSNAP family protein [Spongiactinospora sp. TRM90649]|uniref:NIPSNAP family protein n=1 Tax=Spongiactinospora sp. TRM90649 TaxID=3031114 RepID=UPI0023FA3422|nr:NIPSNAP family protein [Spongiactinospora sp. TRM90649]MDF5755777.1 NIPSNAP family protein [Spongiactinospora sp. TRM90649]
MTASTDSSAHSAARDVPWPVVELRRYTLHPGARETMIDLFDRELVETQEETGMRILGQFRDEDDPDRFVWMRAFPDMARRTESLTAFYVNGPTWRVHGPAAGATMVDSSDALLLRPVGGSLPLAAARAAVGDAGVPGRRMAAAICHRDRPVDAGFVRAFEDRVRPALAAAGAAPLAWFETESAPNTFPRLPVRTDTHVFVWFTAWPDDRLPAEWHEVVETELSARLTGPPEVLRLSPTARSLLR